MKNLIRYAALAIGLLAVQSTKPYTFGFANFTSKKVTVEMFLGGGIDEKREQITVPARQNDGKPGEASKTFGGLRAGLCLSRSDLKIGEIGKELHSVDSDNAGFLLLQGFPGMNSIQHFRRVMDKPDEFIASLSKERGRDMPMPIRGAMRAELLVCYDRVFMIFEIQGKLTLMTWE